MPMLNIEGRQVKVDDSFLKMSPDQQHATVDEIASSFKSSPSPQLVPGQNGAPSRLVMNMGGSQAAPESPGIAEDVAKSAGIGVVKGGVGTVGAAGDVRELLSHGVDYAAEKLGIPPEKVADFKNLAYQGAGMTPAGAVLRDAPTSGNIQKKIEGVTGDFYKPKTKAGEYAQTAGEFLPAAIGGEAGLVGRAARVLVPAATSETAGQLTKGTRAEPVARFLGALAGGGIQAIASRPGSAARSIANQLPEGITEPMVIQADRLMQDAAARGVQLAWPEALSQVAGRPVLTNMMRHLEASPQTEGQMSAFFGERPQQVEGAARQEFNNIAPVNNAPSTIGPAVGRAAGETVSDVRGAINRASDPFYQSAEGVLLTPAEMAQVRRVPGFDAARDAVRNGENAWRVQHLPDESVGFLNAVKKHFDESAQNAGSRFNPGRSQETQATREMQASAVRQIGEAVSPDYQAALGVQRQGREQYLQPLLDGPLGKLSKKDVTTQKAIEALFPRNPLPNSEHEISTAVGALAHRNPRAASDLVRAHAESTFNEAARDLQTGPNQANGAKFRTAIVGNPQQRMNLRAAVEELPNGAERWQGFNRLLDVLEATGTRQGIGSRTAYNQMINNVQGAGGLARDGAKVAANPMKFLQPLADKYDQWKLGSNLRQLADILTDPNSAGMLRAIARAPANTSQSASLALRLVTYADASRTPPVEQRNKK